MRPTCLELANHEIFTMCRSDISKTKGNKQLYDLTKVLNPNMIDYVEKTINDK